MRPPMPAERPMTRGLCVRIQSLTSLPTDPPLHWPCVVLAIVYHGMGKGEKGERKREGKGK